MAHRHTRGSLKEALKIPEGTTLRRVSLHLLTEDVLELKRLAKEEAAANPGLIVSWQAKIRVIVHKALVAPKRKGLVE